MASEDGLGAPEGSEGNSSARLTPGGGSQSLLLSESKDENVTQDCGVGGSCLLKQLLLLLLSHFSRVRLCATP